MVLQPMGQEMSPDSFKEIHRVDKNTDLSFLSLGWGEGEGG